MWKTLRVQAVVGKIGRMFSHDNSMQGIQVATGEMSFYKQTNHCLVFFLWNGYTYRNVLPTVESQPAVSAECDYKSL